MFYIKRFFIWLARCRYSRGFGIQSPNDYSFVMNVINEHAPFYAYSDLKQCFPHVYRRKRRMAELLLRLANWLQPEKVALLSNVDPIYVEYIKAGCNKAIVSANWKSNETKMFVIDRDAVNRSVAIDSAYPSIDSILSTDETVIVITDIYGTNKSLWNELLGRGTSIIIFDLYHIGIILCKKNRYKIKYNLNL